MPHTRASFPGSGVPTREPHSQAVVLYEICGWEGRGEEKELGEGVGGWEERVVIGEGRSEGGRRESGGESDSGGREE